MHAYIWLPWQGTLRDVFLLAHELGHAGHFDLARRHQTYGNTVGEQGRGLFLETPSTVNELLLGRHMLDTAREPGLRRRALLQVLDTFVGSMAVALGGAHLEQRLYDMAEGGDAITLTAIMEAQADIFTRFYGEAIAVDDGVRLRWMQAPHMYWSDLRQSTYAAGLCGACGVTEAIRAEGQPAVDRWLDTLRAGIRLSPLDLMRRTGVDLTSPEGLWQTIDVFARLADDLERNIALTAV